MITLDTSVVIAHLQPADAHHAAATGLLREHAGEDFLLHPVNLAEVLVGGVRAGRADQLLDDLRAIGIREADPAEGQPMRLAALRVETGLKLPDCCALVTALDSGTALATVDARLAVVARSRHLAVLPPRD